VRHTIPSILLFLSMACVSYTPTPVDLSEEFLSTYPPGKDFRQITEDIHVDQAVLDAMRARASSDGTRLLAVIRVPRGIHPYAVIAWRQSGERLQVLETAVYWGRIDAKWNTQASAAELASLTEAAEAEFGCTEGRLADAIYGTGFVSWREGRQITCESGLFAEEGSAFWPRLKEILDRADETYDRFGEVPPN